MTKFLSYEGLQTLVAQTKQYVADQIATIDHSAYLTKDEMTAIGNDEITALFSAE